MVSEGDNQMNSLPSWDRQQLKLFSMVSREFVLPLSLVKQINDLLAANDVAPVDRRRLSQLASDQLNDYLELSQALQQIYSGAFQPLPLEPLNPTAVVADAVRQYSPRLQPARHKLQLFSNENVLVLGNRKVLRQMISALFKYIDSIGTTTSNLASAIDIEIKPSASRVCINITDVKSKLTRPQVKQALSLAGQRKQVDAEYLDSALHLVVAQNLSKQINGQLDFQRRRGRAQWTISLPRSQQLALWT